MPRKKAKLTKSEFMNEPDGNPVFISADKDKIQLMVFFSGEERSKIINLHPRHIESIVAMHSDWWDSHWAAVYEEEA